jgi:hypothetical protein
MLKIFEITHEDGEKEWLTGYTNIGAIAFYVCQTECDLDELATAEIIELPKDKWNEYFIKDEECLEGISFEKYMEDQRNQDIICGTMYDL